MVEGFRGASAVDLYTDYRLESKKLNQLRTWKGLAKATQRHSPRRRHLAEWLLQHSKRGLPQLVRLSSCKLSSCSHYLRWCSKALLALAGSGDLWACQVGTVLVSEPRGSPRTW